VLHGIFELEDRDFEVFHLSVAKNTSTIRGYTGARAHTHTHTSIYGEREGRGGRRSCRNGALNVTIDTWADLREKHITLQSMHTVVAPSTESLHCCRVLM